MPARKNKLPETCQSRFHQCWNHLKDSHVRALAWLLAAPDMLDPNAPQWRGKIATLGPDAGADAGNWLAALDRAPAALHAYLAIQPFTRLGRYAEKLMAFYFEHRNILVASGVQVRAGKSDTIGEFDFLLRRGDDLVHWEFATKVYLLEPSGAGHDADYFVGPNLADTLGAKIRKILERQLSLADHPAAQIYLPQPVASAQALVKGWLFYHDDDAVQAGSIGVSDKHCRGFWCALSELNGCMGTERYAILPRLSWLAPVRLAAGQTLDRQVLRERLASHFSRDSMPVLVALLEIQGDDAIEAGRGFVVPNDWRSRAGERILRAAGSTA